MGKTGRGKAGNVPPSREEICPFAGDLDGEWAVRNFPGKSVGEITRLFLSDSAAPFQLQEDLLWMGPKAFAYYLPAWTAYFRSDSSCGDADTFSSVLGTLELRLKSEPETVMAAREVVTDLLNNCISNDSVAGADARIYGGLKARFIALKRKPEAYPEMPGELEVMS